MAQPSILEPQRQALAQALAKATYGIHQQPAWNRQMYAALHVALWEIAFWHTCYPLLTHQVIERAITETLRQLLTRTQALDLEAYMVAMSQLTIRLRDVRQVFQRVRESKFGEAISDAVLHKLDSAICLAFAWFKQGFVKCSLPEFDGMVCDKVASYL